MIALGGPKLKPIGARSPAARASVSMIALGGPKLKLFLITVKDATGAKFQ